MKKGLMPVCADAALLGEISYAPAGVDCEGLSKALGPVNRIIFIRYTYLCGLISKIIILVII